MISKISVENFKSFDQAVEMTMISSSKIRTKVDHRVQVGSKTRLLKHAIIYGANASGKSNLVDFFRFFKATLDGGIPLWGTRCFCRIKKMRDETVCLKFKWRLTVSFTLTDFQQYYSDG